MKHMRKLIVFVILLIARMCITPARGSMIKSAQTIEQGEIDSMIEPTLYHKK